MYWKMAFTYCYKSDKIMAKLMIKVEKEDVKTTKIGNNIMIQCDNNIDIIFTPEAIEELISDYNNITDQKETE